MEISFGSLRISVCESVYQPSEDSFLLAAYASSLSGKILDMGTGTGIVALAAASSNPRNDVVGLDISQKAVECAKKNAAANGVSNAVFFQSDLFSATSEKFDAILFNPPYLPTTREERLLLGDENLAYDGGESGLEVFRRFVSQAPSHLFLGGKIAVIGTSLGDGIEKAMEELESRVGPASVLAQESFFFEKIALIEAVLR
ncbi:MAG: methyltransferase [Candidatus Micrarchaeota archaeon]|nr:methyltransferase [Candidatus Micrarchaeota archaeon]